MRILIGSSPFASAGKTISLAFRAAAAVAGKVLGP